MRNSSSYFTRNVRKDQQSSHISCKTKNYFNAQLIQTNYVRKKVRVSDDYFPDYKYIVFEYLKKFSKMPMDSPRFSSRLVWVMI